MLEVPVYNASGEKISTLSVDEALFGGTVNVDLVKQAVVAYHANRRQGSAKNKSRGMVTGTRHKMYRQKGTGYARHGTRQANLLRGGGRTFAKTPHSYRKRLPQKMRQAALRSAILAKLLGEDFLVVEGLQPKEPKTSRMARLLDQLDIHRSCLLALAQRDANVYLSSRNIPDLTVRITEELNAFDVVTRQKMLVTSEAMKMLMGEEASA